MKRANQKVVKYTIITLLAIAFAVFAMGRIAQVITVLVLGGGAVYFILKRVDPTMRKAAIALFLTAFILQLLMSLFLYGKTVDTRFYGFSYRGDDYVYGDFGTTVGDLWRRGIFPSLRELAYYNLIGNPGNVSVQHYQLYCAAIFYLFGVCGGQILLIINCFLHAAIIMPAYFICKNLKIKDRFMIFVLFLFLFWPSVFYWALFNFKEPALLLAVFTGIALLMKMQRKVRLRDGVFLSLVLFALYSLKGYLFVFFAAAAFLHLIIFNARTNKRLLGLILLFMVIVVAPMARGIFTVISEYVPVLPKLLFSIRQSSGSGNTPFFSNILSFTHTGTLLYLPFGVSAVILLPFLWRPFTLTHIAVNLETVMWWSLLPFLAGGIHLSIKKELKQAFPVLFLFFFWLFVLALTQGNMGTLIRQKAIIYYLGFIFIGLAVDRTGRRYGR